ncbi:hypothetical protein [Bacillus suaedaesalsae]|uniref:DUF3139 domain-containing protein n=1 Tax=Bacillus suaedaesalsae TaxID=2810349 RepID=A0ABS2DEW4_9BACI|nr:hypothetical protein [Bacillus suaedaesalsae]MBM6617019.1 hypothetical protein [Bacillus suaedaesalsae]
MKILIILSIFVIGLISWRLWSKYTWKTVMIGADERSEEQVREKHDYYRLNGVRCKIVTEIKTNVSGGNGQMMGDHAGPSTGLTKLIVHRKDVEKANTLK